MSAPDPSELLPLADAANVAGVAYSTIWKAVREDRIPTVEIGSRDFISRRDAEAFGSSSEEGKGQ